MCTMPEDAGLLTGGFCETTADATGEAFGDVTCVDGDGGGGVVGVGDGDAEDCVMSGVGDGGDDRGVALGTETAMEGEGALCGATSSSPSAIHHSPGPMGSNSVPITTAAPAKAKGIHRLTF